MKKISKNVTKVCEDVQSPYNDIHNITKDTYTNYIQYDLYHNTIQLDIHYITTTYKLLLLTARTSQRCARTSEEYAQSPY